jgi:hypothetical protein
LGVGCSAEALVVGDVVASAEAAVGIGRLSLDVSDVEPASGGGITTTGVRGCSRLTEAV